MKNLDRVCIRSLDRKLEITYRQLYGNAGELRERLEKASTMGETSAVVAQYGNEPEIFAAFLAARSLGWPIAFLPLDTCLYRARSVASSMAATFGGKTGTVFHLSSGAASASLAATERSLGLAAKLKEVRFDLRTELVASDELSKSLDAPSGRNGKEPILFLFTSGTTGVPKGVGFHEEAIEFFARNILSSTEIVQGSRELLIPNVSHSDGWQRGWATLLNGGRVDLVSTRKLLLEFEQTLRASDPDSFFLPTPMIPMLLKVSKETAGFLNTRRRSVELGSTTIPDLFFKSLIERFPYLDFFYHYGLTECSRTTTLKVRAHTDKWRSVGRVNPGFEIAAGQSALRIRNDIRPRRMLIDGAIVDDQEDFLATKDLAFVDDEGFLFLKGREDDMITLGGHHVFPKEIENIVMSIEGARFCRVVRAPENLDPIFGDMIDVQIVLENGTDESTFLARIPALFRSQVSFHDDLKELVISAKGMKS